MKKRILRAELVLAKFYPTDIECRSWALIINGEVFSEALDLGLIEFKVQQLRRVWGMFESLDDIGHIKIARCFPSKSLFLNVLAHEMIHAHQHQHSEPLGHGPSFSYWVKKFKQNGLVLAVSYGSLARQGT